MKTAYDLYMRGEQIYEGWKLISRYWDDMPVELSGAMQSWVYSVVDTWHHKIQEQYPEITVWSTIRYSIKDPARQPFYAPRKGLAKVKKFVVVQHEPEIVRAIVALAHDREGVTTTLYPEDIDGVIDENL